MRSRLSWLSLVALQVRRPWLVVALIALSLVPTVWLTSRLSIDTSISELLPDSQASVIELRRIEKRLPSSSTLTIVAESADSRALRAFVDSLVPGLEQLGPEWVSSVDSGPRDVQGFFDAHAALFLARAKLEDIHERVLEAYDLRVQKAAGLALSEDEPAPSFDALGRELEQQSAEHATSDDAGYYIGDAGGKLAAVLLHTPVGAFSQRANQLRTRVQALARQARLAAIAGDLRIGLTGDLITGVEAQNAIIADLVRVGALGVLLVLSVVGLYFLRLRVLLCMSLTITVGCIWAFAAASLSVHHLNTASGFLVSIIAGNGINFGIIYMARYLEARSREHAGVEQAVLIAHRETALATLAAALSAAVAYGSLAVTDFRGSRHFGIIGGLGMLLCWIASYALLPAMLVLFERLRPLVAVEPAWRARWRGSYGRPFEWLSRRAPRGIVLGCAVLGVLAALVVARVVREDPLDYDLGHIQNDRIGASAAATLSVRVDHVVGRLGQDGRAIVTERLAQVEPLVSELRHRREQAPDPKPFQSVVSLFDLLPEDQPRKLALLTDISERLERAKRRGFLSDAEYARIRSHLTNDLRPLTIEDLPERVARPFTEKDGTRGRIVYIVPSNGQSVYDAHYLMRWADAFREIRLPDGSLVRGSGEPVIVSDMLLNVRRDAPRAIALSLLGTLLTIGVVFAGRRLGLLAMVSLLLGLAWLLVALRLFGMRLNFLNFIALPITVGVGADYALNMVKRCAAVGGDLSLAVLETGGAVIVCSLTTTLGYLVLLLSINGAVRSFGFVAALGELATVSAAALFVPSFLRVKRSRPGG